MDTAGGPAGSGRRQDEDALLADLGVDRLVQELLDRATQIARSQHKLELLMEANRAILGQLSLDSVLRQIVASARELVDARYAALGVVGPAGDLEQFVHVGMDLDTVTRIGALPTGHGLLRALVDESRPLRLDHLPADPRRIGFPDHHPPMESFLGVPVVVRGLLYGNLYLTEHNGGGFTSDDEILISALGVSAGIAIENARLYEDSRRRQLWAQAAAEVGAALLAPETETGTLELIAETVRELTSADVVSVVVPGEEPDTFRVHLACGEGADLLAGLVYPAAHSVAALAAETAKGVLVDALEPDHGLSIHVRRALDVGPVLGLPLHGTQRSRGVLVAARRHGRPRFEDSDLELGESFAAQAALAMELADARADQQRLMVLEDRQRIARDLHDHVIQRLFASGLALSGLSATVDPDSASRLDSIVDDLDETISQIRTLIFRLQPTRAADTVRAAVVEVVEESGPGLGFAPETSFEGPVDTLVDPDLVTDVIAVVREALSNVVRHARATRVGVRVVASGAHLGVIVSDDGIGIGPLRRRSGLENLRTRAERYGGSCELVTAPAGGTELRWMIPRR